MKRKFWLAILIALVFALSACSGALKATDFDFSWPCDVMGECGNE